MREGVKIERLEKSLHKFREFRYWVMNSKVVLYRDEAQQQIFMSFVGNYLR